MTAGEAALLAVAGFAGGVANAVAGGGTFFTFAAMVASGLTSLEANATSAVALVPGSLAIAAAYRNETRLYARSILPFAAIGAVGGFAGAALLIAIGDAGFRPLVPWLLALATALFAFSGRLRSLALRILGENSAGSHASAYAIMALVSVYGGFFGAGMGIMMLAALAIVEPGNFHKANATKNIVSMLAQAVAIALFASGGLVRWPQAVVATAAAVGGGYLGVALARKVPEAIVRAAVVLLGSALTLVFALR